MTAKCDHEKKSENGHLYCKKSPGGAYCVKDKDSKHSVFVCPLDPGMTAKKKDLKTGPETNNGKSNGPAATGATKKTAKYTIRRNNEDLENLKKLRKVLQNQLNLGFCNNFNTDSAIYKKLPGMYIDVVKTINEQDVAIQELEAKLRDLEQLKYLINKISEICKEEISDNITKKPVVKPCHYHDKSAKECELSDIKCDGKNTKCEDYEAE